MSVFHRCARLVRCSAFCLAVGSAVEARADLRLPEIFGDHMVLQQGKGIPLWGWAAPGESVTDFNRTKYGGGDAEESGSWRIELPAMAAGNSPVDVEIAGRDQKIVLRDVLIGEVWLASGQSNMALPLVGSDDGQREIKRADDSRLRLFTVERICNAVPQPSVRGHWLVCSAESAATYSAVAYYFGREIRRKSGAPVGLIDASWAEPPSNRG